MMLIVNRRIEIGAHPNDRDSIVSKLKELGCLWPDVSYYSANVAGHDIPKVYIKCTIQADKLDALIVWLDAEIKGVVSITY